MKTVKLYGRLGQTFGFEYSLDVDTPAEAVRALCVQLPGFQDAIRNGTWHVVRGSLEESDEVREPDLTVSLGTQNQVHIIPAIEGAGSNGGLISTIVGVVLIAAAFFTGGATLSAWGALQVGMAAAGVGMAVGGIVQMTTKLPGVSDTGRDSPDERASFLFDGPTNQSKQGVPVPRGYGRVKVGSIVVSAGLFAEEIPV
ncbi:Phage-related protein, tail component [Pseudomonas sp. OF001]|uniref:tail assembly protein n=1 Tax=Pseudomonas sp. OF001 TaxID=2772300 RepID=UPI00191A3083|nr:tail assembly protein [Pseudomonas sp. OF001]CAD5377367.1 Phage-related protein, tail component [Pseudomonas sp. OF001]